MHTPCAGCGEAQQTGFSSVIEAMDVLFQNLRVGVVRGSVSDLLALATVAGLAQKANSRL
jgi:hypothetical protein